MVISAHHQSLTVCVYRCGSSVPWLLSCWLLRFLVDSSRLLAGRTVWVFDVPHNAEGHEQCLPVPAQFSVIFTHLNEQRNACTLAFELLFYILFQRSLSVSGQIMEETSVKLHKQTSKCVYTWVDAQSLWRKWACRWDAYGTSNACELLCPFRAD